MNVIEWDELFWLFVIAIGWFIAGYNVGRAVEMRKFRRKLKQWKSS